MVADQNAGELEHHIASASPGGRRAHILAVARGMAERLHGRDLALAAGGLTFYAGLAVVSCLLLAVWLTGLVISPAPIVAFGAGVADLLPTELGAPGAVRRLLDAGARLGPLGAVIAAFPASFYGEGLRRALLRFAPSAESFVGWRGRLLVLPLLVAAPALLLPLLLLAPVLQRLGGAGAAAGVLVGFTAVWLLLALPLGWVYRVVAPVRPAWPAVVFGALATASCLSGFLQGFVLFLSLPLDLGAPFGGLVEIGAVAAVALWLFVLHVVVLLGWACTLAVADVAPAPPVRRGSAGGRRDGRRPREASRRRCR